MIHIINKCLVIVILVIVHETVCYDGLHERCKFTHPQNYFCEDEFTMIARPLNRTPTVFGDLYELEIIREYRVAMKAVTPLSIGLHISVPEVMEGIHMELDRPYLISGQVSRGKAYTSLCHLLEPLDHVNAYQQIGFKTLYEEGCDCIIHVCHGQADCRQHMDEDVCVLDRDLEPDCYTAYGYCARFGPKCQWVKNNILRKCLKQQVISKLG